MSRVRYRMPGLTFEQTRAFRRAKKLERQIADSLSYFNLKEAQRTLNEIDSLLHTAFGEEWRQFKGARNENRGNTLETEPLEPATLLSP